LTDQGYGDFLRVLVAEKEAQWFLLPSCNVGIGDFRTFRQFALADIANHE